MTKNPLRGLKPDHAGISVGDLEASIAWYRDMLGFELIRVVDVPEDTGKVALVRRGDFILELFCILEAAPLPNERRYPWSDIRTHGIKHVAYAVPDVAALMDDLKAKGVDVVWDTRVHDGDVCAFVRDNSGNLVEFVEREELCSAKVP
jgi:catechol 2,3-dioxygenase-like lactoylglutathione lyase family enzyme